ncbi:MAG: 16S rRNA (cytosine(1402)-N(4))-methyltransferase RsmH [Polyangiaceae bacterium]|nr:16S rRNA (cytosine(1402)-N(4))-methyltransferase RsmH [Polyangiaceae bacterium]
MTTEFEHVTVMLEEVVAAIAPRPGGVYADCTLGGAGHAKAVLEASAPDGRLLGIDRDEIALAAAGGRLAMYGERATLVHGELADLPSLARASGFPLFDGVVADLGVSSPQFDDAARGFAFQGTGPLDMRMDRSRGETALELIDRVSESELADILYELGEERRSRPIARSILRAHDAGELVTTTDLVRAVHRVTGPRKGRSTDPATRTFQALRIAVNRELEQLESLMAALPDVLADDGVVAILTFHSLEDRIVKHAFRDDERLEPLFKKPRTASEEELERNPRSRSAKLRVAKRVPRGGPS